MLTFDFGDAPASYGTLMADNGARHIATGPSFDNSRDTELDGQPEGNAMGDDRAGVDDEDGVTFTSPLLRGQSADYRVVVFGGPGPVMLDAWIDFNGNGRFEDSAGERITAVGGTVLAFGTFPNFGTQLHFFIPVDAAAHTFARFRLSTAGNLGPTGPAADGEVEDYALIIRTPLDDTASIRGVSDSAGGFSSGAGVSDDGRYVVFVSDADNVIAAQFDTNGGNDVFLFDRLTGATTLVSNSDQESNVTGNGSSQDAVISADGKFIAFSSRATNLVGQIEANAGDDVFLYDVTNGTTRLVSRSIVNNHTTGNSVSHSPVISADGRFVTFRSDATNLVFNQIDTNGTGDIFRFDRTLETTAVLISGTNTTTTSGADLILSMSGDGERIVFTKFESSGSGLYLYDEGAIKRIGSSGHSQISRDGNFIVFDQYDQVSGLVDVLLYDVGSEETANISRGRFTYFEQSFAISGNGRYIAYSEVTAEAPFGQDVFLYDRETGQKTLASKDIGPPTGESAFSPSISLDGKFLAFTSTSRNLVAGQIDAAYSDDVFLFAGGTTSLVSHAMTGVTTTGNSASGGPIVSGDGKFIVFSGYASDLVPGDTNQNVFYNGEVDAFLFKNPALIFAPPANNSNDAYTIRITSGNIEIVNAANPTQVVASQPLATTQSVVIDGEDGQDDVLTLDFSNGNPIPPGGLTYNAGASGNDGMTIVGTGTSLDGEYHPDPALQGDGSIAINGNIVSFTGLEPIDVSGLATFTVLLPDGDDDIHIDDGFAFFSGQGTPALRVSGASESAAGPVGFETVALWNTGRLVIDTVDSAAGGSDGDDSITINSVTNSHQVANLSIITGTGADTVTFNGGSINFVLAAAPLTENSAGAVVGTIVSSGAFSYSIQPSGDSGQFVLSGNQLLVGAVGLDYEAGATRNVTIRATDTGGRYFDWTFTVQVTNVNESPTDLALSGATVTEVFPDALVGTFTTSDQDANETFTYSIQPGGNGGQFAIAGNQLRVGTTGLDFEAGATRSVTVRTTDSGALYFDRTFIIEINDVNEGPFIVANTNDSGPGSLRQAIVDTNTLPGPDIIEFAASVAGTITLTSGELAITDSVNLQGPGSDVVTVSANNTSLVFRVSASATISGLTITRGNSTDGGGICNDGGTLTVNNSTFVGNTGVDFSDADAAVISGNPTYDTSYSTTYSTKVGSGVYNTNGGVATLSACSFASNIGSGIFNDSKATATALKVSSSTFSGNMGGGIVNTGNLEVNDSKFTANTGAIFHSVTTFPTTDNTFPVGAGIGNLNGGLATIKGSTFDNNDGSAVFNYFASATVGASTFSNNQSGGGGGIFNFEGGLKVNDSAFIHNSAAGLTAYGQSASAGGAICVFPRGTLEVSNSTFSENLAGYNQAGNRDGVLSSNLGYGGAISVSLLNTTAKISNSTFFGNRSSNYGGAIFNFGATLQVANSIIAANSAPSQANVWGNVVSLGHNLVGSNNSAFTATGDHSGIDPLVLNLAPLGNYGGPTQTMALLPGSLAIDNGSNILAVDANNQPLTTDQRGAPYGRTYGTSVDIGAYESRPLAAASYTLTVNSIADTFNPDDGELTLREAITAANDLPGDNIINFSVTGTINITTRLPSLSSNIQIQGPGAASLTLNRAGSAAYRMLEVTAGSVVTVSGLTISNAVGGGIYNDGGTLTVSNSKFSRNAGATHTSVSSLGAFSTLVGSGIYNTNGGVATVTGSTFSDNDGSGIFNYYVSSMGPSITTLIVSGSTFSGNQAGFGGGIFSSGAIAEVSNSTFVHNSAFGLPSSSGGGLNCGLGGTLSLSNSTFSDNQAVHAGAGLSVSFGTLATVSNSTFSGNSAHYAGGIFQYGSTLTVTNSTLSGNTATTGAGGGIWSSGSGLTVGNTIIAGNTAPAGPDFVGVVTSSGYNLIGDASGSSGFGATGDLVGFSPMLAPLGDYGGPTQTMALLPGSPAIDAGSATVPGGVPATDQRGAPYTRIFGSSVDIGAFESRGLVVGGTAGNDTIAITPRTQSGTLNATINGIDYVVVTGVSGVVTVDGQGGSDTLTVNGTAGNDYIFKDATHVTLGNPVQQTILYNGIASLIIHGGGGNDTIVDPGSDTAIFGDEGDDTIIINATSGSGVTANGGAGSDTYVIGGGNLAGPVKVADNGTTGTDTIRFIAAGTITQSPVQIVFAGASGEPATASLSPGNEIKFSPETFTFVAAASNTDPVTVVLADGTAVGLTPGRTVNGNVQSVAVDIQPDSLNLDSNGTMSVMVYGGLNFDVTKINIASVRFAGASAWQSSLVDANHDGKLDLQLKFRRQDTALEQIYEELLVTDHADGTLNSTSQAALIKLTGETVDGLFSGSDSINLFLAGRSLQNLLRRLFG